MSPVMRYSALRVAVLGLAFVLLYLAGARGLLLILLAVLVSGIVSFFVLASQREAMSGVVERRVDRARRRMEERTAAEDAADEERRRDLGEGGPQADDGGQADGGHRP